MSDKYILDGHTPVPCNDVLAWGCWFENPEHRRVAATVLSGGVRVSTVFLGLDHNWGEGPPALFETMIFEGPHDSEQWRYSTWDEAVAGHEAAVVLAKAGAEP